MTDSRKLLTRTIKFETNSKEASMAQYELTDEQVMLKDMARRLAKDKAAIKGRAYE